MATLLVFIYKNFYKFFNSLWVNLDNFAILKIFKNNIISILNKEVDGRLFGFLISLLLILKIYYGSRFSLQNPFWILGFWSVGLLSFLITGLVFKKSLIFLEKIQNVFHLISTFLIKHNPKIVFFISFSLSLLWLILVCSDTFKATDGCLGIKAERYNILVNLFFIWFLFLGYAASTILEKLLGKVGKNITLLLIWPVLWYLHNLLGVEQFPHIGYDMFQQEGSWLFLPYQLFYENYAFLAFIQFYTGSALYSLPHLLSSGSRNILNFLKEVYDIPQKKFTFFAIFLVEKSYFLNSINSNGS